METMDDQNTQPNLSKLPFTRIKRALNQVASAIPLHTETLKKQGRKISSLKNASQQRELWVEQTNAAKTVQLLKNDLYELEQLNLQVKEEDQDQFYELVQNPIRDAVEVLSEFLSAHSDILGPFPDLADGDYPKEFPAIICHPDQELSEEALQEQQPIQLQTHMDLKPPENFGFLRKELLEINQLMHKFAQLVMGRQQDNINAIENNIEHTKLNVIAGNKSLRTASILKATAFPLTGAIVGCLILGPVGAFVGFKAAVVCAAGGSVVGYSAGKALKNKHQSSLEAIEYPMEERKPSVKNEHEKQS